MVGGLSWGYVGPSWGYVGPSWGQCGPILGLCWPILGRCWPILELCWPILGLCWPILRPMLAHLEAYVGPCWPILSHKIRNMTKNVKSTKHRKMRGFLATRGGSAAGAAAPLSYGEERTAVRQCHRQGAPGRIWRASTIPDVLTPSPAARPTRLWRLLGRRFLRSRCRTRLSCDPLANRWGLVRFVPKTDWKKKQRSQGLVETLAFLQQVIGQLLSANIRKLGPFSNNSGGITV